MHSVAPVADAALLKLGLAGDRAMYHLVIGEIRLFKITPPFFFFYG